MECDFKPINVRCRPGRLVFKISAIFILGFILTMAIVNWFSQYTEIKVWHQSVLKSCMICWFIFFIIIFFIVIKKKTNKYTIFCYDKIVIKNGKEMQYDDGLYTQTALQKCFGVIDIKFWNNNEKIILRDVSKEILYYI